jgi:hypothetical protein
MNKCRWAEMKRNTTVTIIIDKTIRIFAVSRYHPTRHFITKQESSNFILEKPTDTTLPK